MSVILKYTEEFSSQASVRRNDSTVVIVIKDDDGSFSTHESMLIDMLVSGIKSY